MQHARLLDCGSPKDRNGFVIMVLFALLSLVNASHGQIPTYGNRQAVEYGDMVYRQLGFWSTIGLDYNHTAIFAGIDGSDTGKAMEAKGEGFGSTADTTVGVNFADFNGPNQTYYGAYTLDNWTLSFTDRKDIVTTATSLSDAYISYVVFDALDYYGSYFDGNITDISNIRCDGFTEYCYNRNSFAVWWPAANPSHWSILNYPDDFNDAPTPPSNPAVEFSPWAQRGAPGHAPTYNTHMTQPSVISVPTYEVTQVAGNGYVDVTIRATDESGVHYIGYKKPGDTAWSYSPKQSQHPTSDSFFYVVRVTNSGVLYAFAVDNGGNFPANASGYTISVTSVPLPTVKALAASEVSATSARLRGQVTASGGAVILERRIEWAKTLGAWGSGSEGIDYGVITDANLTGADSEFSAVLSGLQPSTGYKFRVSARNSSGWSDVNLANVMTFTTSNFTQTRVITISGEFAFGDVAVGTVVQHALAIANTGNSAMKVTGISFPKGFAGSWSGTIEANGSQVVMVTFTPSSAIRYGGVATVNSDRTSGLNTVTLSGAGKILVSPLTLLTNGTGQIKRNFTGNVLEVGKKYTVTAVAGAGQVFSNWTGTVSSSSNSFTFVMQSNMVLKADFVPNPFLSAQGIYNGLFAASNGFNVKSAGMLSSLSVDAKGTYTGRILINGGSYSIRGAFNVFGYASNYISRSTLQGGPLVVELAIDWSESPSQLTGTVFPTNGEWTGDLVAHTSGKGLGSAECTILIPPVLRQSSEVPPGYGYALMTNNGGIVTISGVLADGVTFNQTVPISQNGDLPVYSSIYGSAGLLIGWLNLSNSTPVGNLAWIKKASRSTLLYTNGFDSLITVQGSPWRKQPGHISAIDLPVGKLEIADGMLPAPLMFNVALSNNNVLVKLPGNPTNALTGLVDPKTGLISLTFGNGSGKATTIAKGALLQNSTNGGGFFLSKTNAGSFTLQP